MPTFRFEGRQVAFDASDTIASALYRSGVRIFTRSFKYHRPRGLYCLFGDCPNCLLNVDGVPGVRACVTPAHPCEVRREGGVPNSNIDVLAVLNLMRRLMPVGFYYKTFIRPRWAWPVAERVIERVTGIGALPVGRAPRVAPVEHVHTDILVVGGGPAGLGAAIETANAGANVIVCEEGLIGERVTDEALRARLAALHEEAAALGVRTLQRATAIGVYEGPMVPVTTPHGLVIAHAGRVIVATGAHDRHEVFRGNDLPGVWQGRGAASLIARHGLLPGRRAVVMAGGPEAGAVVTALRESGVTIEAVVVPEEAPVDGLPGVDVIRGDVERALGRRRVRGVEVRTTSGSRRIACDALIVARALVARDVLLRMSEDPAVVGAGEVLVTGIDVGLAIEDGRRAARGIAPGPPTESFPEEPRAGMVCLCEDVTVHDLEQAREEGFGTSELMKRYTTAAMGPCQGLQCGRYVACMSRPGAAVVRGPGPRTTARPPARAVSMEQIAGASWEGIVRRTALHDAHLAAGGTVGPSGAWLRPFHYGDAEAEYRAVRERVSVMDVSTLGKFEIVGPEAAAFVDHVVPGRTRDLVPGRARYVVLLDEAGYVADDGMLTAVAPECFTLTTTSGGATRMAAWLGFLADRLGSDAHVVDVTEVNGAIVVAGPRARALLVSLTDADLGPEAFPYMTRREIVVAGVRCEAIRVGFVGEVSFELHHRRDESVALWDALVDAGAGFGLVPHGLDALDVLRLEKGHLYIGQDTLPDDTPRKLGLSRLVDMGKGPFAGREGLCRLDGLPLERTITGLTFPGDPDPTDIAGQPIVHDSAIVGRVTSCAYSPTLGTVIGLGWVEGSAREATGGLRAGDAEARPARSPFLDREGTRVRS